MKTVAEWLDFLASSHPLDPGLRLSSRVLDRFSAEDVLIQLARCLADGDRPDIALRRRLGFLVRLQAGEYDPVLPTFHLAEGRTLTLVSDNLSFDVRVAIDPMADRMTVYACDRQMAVALPWLMTFRTNERREIAVRRLDERVWQAVDHGAELHLDADRPWIARTNPSSSRLDRDVLAALGVAAVFANGTAPLSEDVWGVLGSLELDPDPEVVVGEPQRFFIERIDLAEFDAWAKAGLLHARPSARLLYGALRDLARQVTHSLRFHLPDWSAPPPSRPRVLPDDCETVRLGDEPARLLPRIARVLHRHVRSRASMDASHLIIRMANEDRAEMFVGWADGRNVSTPWFVRSPLPPAFEGELELRFRFHHRPVRGQILHGPEGTVAWVPPGFAIVGRCADPARLLGWLSAMPDVSRVYLTDDAPAEVLRVLLPEARSWENSMDRWYTDSLRFAGYGVLAVSRQDMVMVDAGDI